MKNNTIITPCGIIKNAHLPRVGVISANSELLESFIYDEIDKGINISYESYMKEQEQEIRAGFMTDEEADDNDDRSLTYRLEQIVEERLEEFADMYESDNDTILFGDAWKKEEDGSYTIDRTKEFAATYGRDHNEICVEWSKNTRKCHYTSPCYVMADGSGPCGNLDRDGDEILAYDLPSDFYLPPVFYYYIDLDERGMFHASVRDRNDRDIFSFNNFCEEEQEYGELDMIRDGFMKHTKDLIGLEKYLKDVGLIPKNSDLKKGN
jgi:hypothetical protein